MVPSSYSPLLRLLLSSLLVLCSLLPHTLGHGVMTSPASRNFYASAEQSGRWWVDPNDPDSDTVPLPESCPHCLNRQSPVGFCGTTQDGERDYDFPMSWNGVPLDNHVKATFAQGSIITVDSTITAHHRGFFSVRGCADWQNPTEECFAASPLLFVEDLSPYWPRAPHDSAHPGRAYLHPNVGASEADSAATGGVVMTFVHTFQLPPSLVGEHVLLQWHYTTANSCLPAGMLSVDWPEGGESWISPGLPACSYPLGEECEQFWNCADVAVTAVNAPTVAPTEPPAALPTPVPVSLPTAPPTMHDNGGGCCDYWGACDCIADADSWCDASAARCTAPPPGGCGGGWCEELSDSATLAPSSSTHATSGCCNYWGECEGEYSREGGISKETIERTT